MADFTKSGAQVDEWAEIAAAGIRKGAVFDIPDDIGILLLITVAHSSANAHANGALVTIEGSENTSGDEDWAEVVPGGLRSLGGTADEKTVDQNSSGTTLYVSGTTGYESKMLKFFIKDDTIANSEIARVQFWSVAVSINCMKGMTNSHALTTTKVYNIVDEWVILVPKEFRRAVVNVWNDDADCTICTRTRKALATDIQ